MTYTIVAILDKPSTRSFGMVGFIVKINNSEMYQTVGLSKNRIVTYHELNNQLGGHVLEVHSPLPPDFINPAALWLGTGFYAEAIRLKAPHLPVIDDNWYHPPEPNTKRGNYAIKESKETYKILENWVTEAAREALVRNNHDLAVLTRWTLPSHAATRAALYFTAQTAIQKERELELQLRIDRRKISSEELKKEHKEVRNQLLKRKQ